MRTAIALTLLVVSTGSCQHRPVILRDAEQGMQWYWPHFLDGKPTILAFWSTEVSESLESLYAIDGLNTLSLRDVPVELVSVATGPIEEIHAWIQGRRGSPIRFKVLVDEEERLAKTLDVTYYPTFIYFDSDGDEIDRIYSIKNISKWHNTRWLKRAGAIP